MLLSLLGNDDHILTLGSPLFFDGYHVVYLYFDYAIHPTPFNSFSLGPMDWFTSMDLSCLKYEVKFLNHIHMNDDVNGGTCDVNVLDQANLLDGMVTTFKYDHLPIMTIIITITIISVKSWANWFPLTINVGSSLCNSGPQMLEQ